MASNTIIEKYPLYNLGISSEEVERTLKNSAQKADVDVLQERINKIKYYGDADIEISPDEWFVFNDEEHTVLGGLSEGHENETSIVIPYSVTAIDDSAFYNCESLTSVTMPNSVTTIRRQAFGDCTHLTSVTISDGVTSIGDNAFRGCSSLTNVIIPNSVRSIGDNAFIDCISLTSVEIPDSVTSIGKLAFFGCTSLTSVIVPDRVTSIGQWTFYGCSSLKNITIGNSVTSIGDRVFVGCRSLINITVNSGNKNYVSVDGNLFDKNQEILIQYAVGKQDTQYIIPNSVRIIIDNAFIYGYSLTSITVSNNVTSIGEYAFTACSSLTDIYYDGTLEEWNAIVPDHLGIAKSTKIHTLIAKGTCGDNLTWTLNEDYELVIDGTGGMYDFTFDENDIPWQNKAPWNTYDNNIKTIIINNGVKNIADGAFFDCNYVTSVVMQGGIERIGRYAFSMCNNLEDLTIPSSVTSIADNAFYDCIIKSISIPDSVVSVGNEIFDNCRKLTDVNIGKGITAISEGMFVVCESLEKISIPDGVTSIENRAFYNCTSLKIIIIPDSVTNIADNAFGNCTNLTIYCEQGSYADTYAKANNIPVKYTDIYIDKTVTANSENAVSSGAVFEAVGEAASSASEQVIEQFALYLSFFDALKEAVEACIFPSALLDSDGNPILDSDGASITTETKGLDGFRNALINVPTDVFALSQQMKHCIMNSNE